MLVSHDGDGRYDENLLLVVGGAGVVLLVFFTLTPVLRPYYALLMPAVLALGASATWALLRAGRQAAAAAPSATTDQPDDTEAGR